MDTEANDGVLGAIELEEKHAHAIHRVGST